MAEFDKRRGSSVLETEFDTTEVTDRGFLLTDTIYVEELFLKDSGSPARPSIDGVKNTSFGKLLHALPIPALLLDQGGTIEFANDSCAKMGNDYLKILGRPFITLFPEPSTAAYIDTLIEKIFLMRRQQVTETLLQVNSSLIWGRLNFRSIRLGENQAILVLIEDLSLEKKQLILNKKYQEELERRVEERTAALQQSNIRLQNEILERKKAEKALQRINDGLEQSVEERTREVLRANVQLRAEIRERQLADQKLQGSYERLEKVLEETASALASVVEMRDPFTAGHQRRVARLAGAVGREMGFSEERIRFLTVAGMLHDVGKICVPAEILSKPGKLKQLEFAMIKMHCQAGYDILKGIPFSWPLADIVLQHHERLDGSGYPKGLKGSEIHIEAGILAVADVVESMYSHRPYRPALGRESALLEMRDKRGILYHADIVDACLSALEQGFELDA